MSETTALATRVIGPPGPNEWTALREQAAAIAKTEFVPAGLRGRPEAVLACVLSGRELGIGPMQALQQIAVIDGKPSLAAELQRALVYRAGHRFKIVDATDRQATAWGKRSDNGDEDQITYALADAVRAGLCRLDEQGVPRARSQQGKPMPWEKYPRQMLVARVTSELVSRLFPEVLAGISYTTDELTDGEVVAEVDVEIVAEESAGSQASSSPTSSLSGAPDDREAIAGERDRPQNVAEGTEGATRGTDGPPAPTAAGPPATDEDLAGLRATWWKLAQTLGFTAEDLGAYFKARYPLYESTKDMTADELETEIAVFTRFEEADAQACREAAPKGSEAVAAFIKEWNELIDKRLEEEREKAASKPRAPGGASGEDEELPLSDEERKRFRRQLYAIARSLGQDADAVKNYLKVSKLVKESTNELSREQWAATIAAYQKKANPPNED